MDKDPGLTGNLLVERLVGANVQLISKEEYAQIGSVVCFHYPTILDACVLVTVMMSYIFLWLMDDLYLYPTLLLLCL